MSFLRAANDKFFIFFIINENDFSAAREKCIAHNIVNLFLWTFYIYNESVEHVARAKYLMRSPRRHKFFNFRNFIARDSRKQASDDNKAQQRGRSFMNNKAYIRENCFKNRFCWGRNGIVFHASVTGT